MDEHELIRFMKRFPDKINSKKMVSRIWKCSTCGEIYKFNEEKENPAPCIKCGGIFFETIRD